MRPQDTFDEDFTEVADRGSNTSPLVWSALGLVVVFAFTGLMFLMSALMGG